MTEITCKANDVAREIAELLQRDGGVTVVVQATPAPILHRLAFLETTRAARNRMRRANLPAMSKLLFYEQTFIAEDRGDFRADHKTTDIAKATGMSDRSVRRHQQHLSGAKFLRLTNDGCGAGGKKGVELTIPDDTVVEISRLLEAKPAT